MWGQKNTLKFVASIMTTNRKEEKIAPFIKLGHLIVVSTREKITLFFSYLTDGEKAKKIRTINIIYYMLNNFL